MLIQIRVAALNRWELFTRQGSSNSTSLDIEAVGEALENWTDKVWGSGGEAAAAMDDMDRIFVD